MSNYEIKKLKEIEEKEREKMARPIELGIGFLTGRTNICNIINNCYKDMLEQLKKYPEEVHLTISTIRKNRILWSKIKCIQKHKNKIYYTRRY